MLQIFLSSRQLAYLGNCSQFVNALRSRRLGASGVDSPPHDQQHIARRTRHRPPPRAHGTFAAVLTIAWRAMLKIKHVPFQLFDVLVFPIMMTFMFTYLFGGALAGP